MLYVLAADMSKVAEPGRSLGHMFVEKVFQLSVELPQLSEEQPKPYWKRLVDAGDTA